MGCGFAQSSYSLSLAFAGLGLCIGFPWSWFFQRWAVVVNMLPLGIDLVLNLATRAVFFLYAPSVLFLPLLCCGNAQASPRLSLAFGGLWFCIGFPWS